jgi:uncharacterized protein YjiS (DUF1127 family)
MTDIVFHPTRISNGTSWRERLGRLAARLQRAFHRTMIINNTRRALEALPDRVIRDIGLTRDDIAFVADAIASAHEDPAREAPDRVTRGASGQKATARRLPRTAFYLALALQVAAATFSIGSVVALAQHAQTERGVPGEKPSSFVMKIVPPEAATTGEAAPK